MSNRVLPPEEFWENSTISQPKCNKNTGTCLGDLKIGLLQLAILYGLPANHLAKMQRLQNACARVITRTGRRSHITPVLKELHWLPVHRRIEYKILSHTYRAIHHQSPVYLSDLLSVYRPTRSLRSESTIMLTVPRTRTVTYGDRTFTKAAATLWNSLPVNIRNCDTCTTFQRQLKTFLFRHHYIDNK